MNEQALEQKANAVGVLIGNLFVIGLVFALASIFDINSAKEYGWFMGGLHGAWIPANWILSLFNDSVLLKAPLHTNAYNTWWWIGVVIGVWSWIRIALQVIVAFRAKSNE